MAIRGRPRIQRIHPIRPTARTIAGAQVRIHRRWRHGGQPGVVLRTQFDRLTEWTWFLVRLRNGAEAWFAREQFDFTDTEEVTVRTKERRIASIQEAPARAGF